MGVVRGLHVPGVGGFHTVRGDIDPGYLRFRLRVVEFVEIRNDL